MSKALSKAMKVSVLALSMFAAYANAADVGGVKLTGSVFDSTCRVTVNSEDAAAVPTVSIGSLRAGDATTAAVGDLVGSPSPDLTIEVSDCSNTSNPKAISFNQGVYGSVDNGKSSYKNSLIGQVDAATGVNAAIIAKPNATADYQAVDFNAEIPLIQTSDVDDDDAPYVGSVVVKAQYMKTNANITSGAFESIATFDIVYI